MFNLDTSFSIIILVLDLFGTVVFAATGALRAIEHKYDIVGIIILATVTGIFGGVMRDTILGIFPPNNFSDTIHIVMTTITAIIIFLLYHRTKKYENLFNIFDAVGLGVFTFTGASIAYSPKLKYLNYKNFGQIKQKIRHFLFVADFFKKLL